MTSKRKSFVLHIDSLEILDDLTDDQAGVLFKAIKAYQNDDEFYLENIVKMVFIPFKNQFIRDNDKYTKTCERRAIAGSKGGKQKVANASNSKQKVANVADSVSKKKSDSKNNSKSDSDSKKEVIDFSLLNLSEYELSEMIRIRKKNKGGSLTNRVIKGLAKELDQARVNGFTNDQILTEWETRGWKSFKAEWVTTKQQAKSTHSFDKQKYTSGKF